MPRIQHLTVLLIFLVVIGPLLSSPASSQDPTLKERVSALELRVTSLEAKVASLAGSSGPPSAAPRKLPSNWKELSVWRTQVRRGMSKGQIREILGEPDKIVEYSISGTTWYYGYPGGGEVRFDASGAGNSWSEP